MGKRAKTIAATLLCIAVTATIALACIWDRDTLKLESEIKPDAPFKLSFDA